MFRFGIVPIEQKGDMALTEILAQENAIEKGQPVFSVSELSYSLKKSVEEKYSNVKIRGEISGLKKHSSGHIYYVLKDENAVIDAVSWRGSYSNAPIALEDGLEIIATGRVTTYPARSKYQFIVESFETTGQGALLKLLEDRKKKLAAEGLFDSSRKKPLPPFPQTIGVVTSPTGAVIRDILHRIQDRFPCHVLIWPVPVQGTDAAPKIAQAIEGFNKMPKRPDLIIVARGGGSLEDLWAFNEEIVVRAAANSVIPLISAVGHETDTTLIDYASDLRAPTPTGAAELSIPVLLDLWNYLQDRDRRQRDVIHQFLNQATLKLSLLERGIPDPRRLIEDYILRVDDWTERLTKALPQFCTTLSNRLTLLTANLRHPQQLLEKSQDQLHYLSTRLEQASFHKILERGFCLATDSQGHALSNAASFPSNLVHLNFKDGIVPVIKIEQNTLLEHGNGYFGRFQRSPQKKSKKKATDNQPTLF